jgi:2-keto-3-deoxy-L-rhamnonate aldolase RhmA
MNPTQVPTSFAQRLRAGNPVGTFVKTPSFHATEIVGLLGYDFVVIDEEHAPLNRETIDSIILAAQAHKVAPLVRLGEPTDFSILSHLDAGATGVLVPHVDSADMARRVAAACRYRGGRRGFSRTGRAGQYGGTDTAGHLTSQDANTLCIPMIEDPGALDVIDAIAAVDGVSALFVGRGDLSVAMGEPAQTSARVRAAADRVIAAGRQAGKPVIMLAVDDDDQAALTAAGVRAFLTGSDQAFLCQTARAALAACKAVAARTIPA